MGNSGFVRWVKERLAAVIGLALAVGIILAILIIYFCNPAILDELEGYGYLGAFVISIILNGTVLLPVSNMAVMASLGATLPVPLFVGLAGGAGASIGEMTGYLLGRSGRDLVAQNRMYTRVEGWVRRWGWLAVFLLSVFPFVFDVVGIIAGAMRMRVWKFWLACWTGRTVSYVAAAYLGSLWLKHVPWWGYLVGFILLILVVLAINRWTGGKEQG